MPSSREAAHEVTMLGPHPPQSPGLAPPQGQNDQGGKHFESIQDIKAAWSAQLKTLRRELSRVITGRGQSDQMSAFDEMSARGTMLRGSVAVCP